MDQFLGSIPRGLPVGSGGWLNITEKFAKAKSYCARPFEISHEGTRKTEIPISGEWIGTYRNGSVPPERRQVDLICGDSTLLAGNKAYDGIFTDPPYFGNVQYAELMDFCYVWLRKLAGGEHPEFVGLTTRNPGELTGNINMGRDLAHFTEGISNTFSRAVARLKSGSPLAFTYHHNKLDAYVPLAVAILDSGLVCSASLPCPAEMGASIHINGTGSSVIDTVFVCRSTGRTPRKWIVDTPEGVATIIRAEMDALSLGGLNATQGDIRCIAHGHLTRLAIWNLRQSWDPKAPVSVRMDAIREWFSAFGGLEAVLNAMHSNFSQAPPRQDWMMTAMVQESPEIHDEISF